MALAFEKELSHLDELVHQPKRLSILAALEPHSDCPFSLLMDTTGLTQGNLSSHLIKLEGAGLVRTEKRFVGKRPQTIVGLTKDGRKAIERYWKRMEELAKQGKKRRRIFGKGS